MNGKKLSIEESKYASQSRIEKEAKKEPWYENTIKEGEFKN